MNQEYLYYSEVLADILEIVERTEKMTNNSELESKQIDHLQGQFYRKIRDLLKFNYKLIYLN